MDELAVRVWGLQQQSGQANISLTIDAEEVDRLELVQGVSGLLARVAEHCPQWRGFGLGMQVYQTRAGTIVTYRPAAALPRCARCVAWSKAHIGDRRGQARPGAGPPGYPVFTHKHHTDISYPVPCTRTAGRTRRHLTPICHAQRGHHCRHPANGRQDGGRHLNWQRLHGMGEGVPRGAEEPLVSCRVYAWRAPTAIPLATWCAACWRTAPTRPSCTSWPTKAWAWKSLNSCRCAWSNHASLPLPAHLFGEHARARSVGVDLTVPLSMREAAHGGPGQRRVPVVPEPIWPPSLVVFARAEAAGWGWRNTDVAQRSAAARGSRRLSERTPQFCALLVKEAHKTWATLFLRCARRRTPCATTPMRPSASCSRWRSRAGAWRARWCAALGVTGRNNTLT